MPLEVDNERSVGSRPVADAMRTKVPLPDGWRIVRLGDVADIAFSSVDKRTVDGELPVQLCNYTDVFYNRRIRPGMDFMAATASPVECQRWALRVGDVLFTKDSETPEEIGIPAYVTEDMPNVLCGYHLGVARPKDNLANGAYLSETLGSPTSARQLARIANGVTRFGLTLQATRSLSVLLPPLSEQRGIASVLDSIDEAIERTEAVIATTERLRDALLHELLTRGVPGWHSEWKEAPGIGTIPACWDVVRLGDVCGPPEYGAGAPGTNYNPSLPRYVRITDLTDDGRLRAEDVRSADPSRVVGFELEPGDLLFARSGATVGKTYMHRLEDGPCVYAGYLIRFRATRDLAVPDFLRWFTHSHPYASWVASMFRAGAQPNINGKEYASMSVPLPPMAEQQTIATTLNRVDDAIQLAHAEQDELSLLRASAMDALLTGRVRLASEGDAKLDFKEH